VSGNKHHFRLADRYSRAAPSSCARAAGVRVVDASEKSMVNDSTDLGVGAGSGVGAGAVATVGSVGLPD
jgi:hypothetical protein